MMGDERKLRVGVVFGGRSGEHEVSLVSARSVIGAMDPRKYEIVPIGITKEGRWIASGDPMRMLASGDEGASAPAALLGDPSRRGLMRLEDKKRAVEAVRMAELDVVFPVLHGPYGEDGTIQGLLELAGIPYVGADVTGSALGMDKAIFKDVMRAYGFPLVEYVVLKRREWDVSPEGVLDRIEAALGYPLFTKPANLGSSVGIGKCHDRAGLARGLAEAARYDRKLIVEAAVPQAREIEVSVLGNDEPIASLPGEIVPSREFYSYAAKYLDEGEDASELYVNEVNTIPGFTSISMYPKLWEASGIPYPELIDRLIELALERRADRERSATSYRPEEA
jgi:D-alanine-D-alanine ligase